MPSVFWYWDKGDLAIVGRYYAVADLRFARFAGLPAWLPCAGVPIYSLIGFATDFSSCFNVALHSSRNGGRFAY